MIKSKAVLLQKIFDIQYVLNSKYMESIGEDYEELLDLPITDKRKLQWVENYMKAYSNELEEIFDSFCNNLPPEMIQEEMIDGLHFLVSMSQMFHIHLENDIYPYIHEHCFQKNHSYKEKIFMSFIYLEKLRRKLPWKWWKDYLNYNMDKSEVRLLFINLWIAWIKMFFVEGNNIEEAYDIYTMKVAKNHSRLDREIKKTNGKLTNVYMRKNPNV